MRTLLFVIAIATVTVGCTASHAPDIYFDAGSAEDATPCPPRQDGAIRIPGWLVNHDRATRDLPPIDAGPCE